MTATGQLIPLPVLPLLWGREDKHEPLGAMDLSRPRRPRIYRIPRTQSWASSAVYGADGRMSYEGAAGERIDVLA